MATNTITPPCPARSSPSAGRLRRATNSVETEDGIKPLPDCLVAELTAYRTLALRQALAKDADTAFVAVLHALCLAAFYHYGTQTCLEIAAKNVGFDTQAPGSTTSRWPGRSTSGTSNG